MDVDDGAFHGARFSRLRAIISPLGYTLGPPKIGVVLRCLRSRWSDPAFHETLRQESDERADDAVRELLAGVEVAKSGATSSAP
jgi:hypothetical protein